MKILEKKWKRETVTVVEMMRVKQRLGVFVCGEHRGLCFEKING